MSTQPDHSMSITSIKFLLLSAKPPSRSIIDRDETSVEQEKRSLPQTFSSPSPDPLQASRRLIAGSLPFFRRLIAGLPPPGKMNLNFQNNERWPLDMDILLFQEVLRAREQKDDYLGLSWNDEKMWQRIQYQMSKTQLNNYEFDVDEIKDRVRSYRSAYRYKRHDLVCRRSGSLQALITDVFEEIVNAGSATVPQNRSRSQAQSRAQSRSHTTTCTGQLSIGPSTAHGGGILSENECETLMLELEKLRGPNPTDLTSNEFYWALDYFSTGGRLPFLLRMKVQDRLPFIKEVRKNRSNNL